MRNKYKNLQNRNQSPKNTTSILLSEKRTFISNLNTNNINRNSFISNYEKKEKDKKIINENNDKEKDKKRVYFSKQNISEKKNETKYSEFPRNKNEEIISSKYAFKKINDNKSAKYNIIVNNYNNSNVNNSANKNCQNISQRFTVRKRNENQNEQNKKKIDIIEIKYPNNNDKNIKTIANSDHKDYKDNKINNDNKDLNINYIFNFRKNKYSASFVNTTKTKIDDLDTNFKNKNAKPEIKIQKINYLYNDMTHNFSSNSISSLNKTQQFNNQNNNNISLNKTQQFTNSNSNNNNTSNEKNNEMTKKTYNFRKLRARESTESKEYNENDKKSMNSPKTSNFLLTPNSQISDRKNQKLNYRIKRGTNNDNISEQNEAELNNNNDNKNNKDNTNNVDIRKRNYIIKVTKTPNENNTKNNENDNKTEDINLNKKKIRRFLYFKSNKNMFDNMTKEENTISPKNLFPSNTTQSDKISPENSVKKANNRVNNINISNININQKLLFKPLIREDNNKNGVQNSINNVSAITQSNSNNINNDNFSKESDINQTFSCFSNEIELNFDKKNNLFNLNYDYNTNNNASNFRNKRNKSLNNNPSIHTNNSINSVNKNRHHSPFDFFFKKKTNLVRAESIYKMNSGNSSPKSAFSPNRNPNIDKISIKSIKRLNSPYTGNNISNNIINNNTYNTTLNIFKMTSKDKKKLNNIVIAKLQKDKKPDQQEQNDINPNYKKHLRTNSDSTQGKSSLYFSMANENNSNSNSFSNISNVNSNHNSSSKSLSELINKSAAKSTDANYQNNINNNNDNRIDLQILYILEAKLQNILYKINKYIVCHTECFDLITYYFSSKFYEKEIKLFKAKHSINNMSYYIKFELLCYFLCYDVCFNKSFNQTGILLKTIFSLLHNNYLMIISFILNDEANYKTMDNVKMWIYKLNNIIDKNLKIKLMPQDYSEIGILTLIGNNLKEVNNYYKMIIDNLYSHFYTKKNNKKNYNDTKYKFPHCLQLDINELDYYEKLNVISLFFFDAYRLLNNYNFEDLKYFFDSFLQRTKYRDPINKDNISNIQNRSLSKNKGVNIKSVVIYKYNYANGNFYYLPPIKKCYKYTLVLDLDETLIYLMPNNIYLNSIGKFGEGKHTLILRPGLINFLQKMKPLYELVIFSFGTYQYVDNVIKIIEKKEKFFEHVLYRQHATVNNGEYIKDLSLLGRDLKNIIIVDDIPQVFKLQERNGICIKAFYGDTVTERNTLKILGKILETVRFDAEETGDIRKSLDKQRNIIFTHITTNLE